MKIQYSHHMKSLYSKYRQDGEEFSYIPHIEKRQLYLSSQFTLKEVIRQTLFSTSPNDSNKMMTGELIEVNDNILKVVLSTATACRSESYIKRSVS